MLTPSSDPDPRLTERTLYIRKRYPELVAEYASTLSERVRFHIKHVEEYLDRCVGMARAFGRVERDLMSTDLGVCVVVATDLATRDIEDYCSIRNDDTLRSSWYHYSRLLSQACQDAGLINDGLEKCLISYQQIRDAHDQVT